MAEPPDVLLTARLAEAERAVAALREACARPETRNALEVRLQRARAASRVKIVLVCACWYCARTLR